MKFATTATVIAAALAMFNPAEAKLRFRADRCADHGACYKTTTTYEDDSLGNTYMSFGLPSSCPNGKPLCGKGADAMCCTSREWCNTWFSYTSSQTFYKCQALTRDVDDDVAWHGVDMDNFDAFDEVPLRRRLRPQHLWRPELYRTFDDDLGAMSKCPYGCPPGTHCSNYACRPNA